MKKNLRLIPGLLALLGVLLLTACSQEKSIETPAGKVTVKENAGEIKIKTDEGEDLEIKYGKDSLVAGFPKEIPIYTPSRVTMSQILKGNNAMAALSTPDDPAKVVQFYKNSLAGHGWSMEGEMSMGGITVLQGKKGAELMNVSVAKTESETTIALALTQEDGQ